MSFSSAAVGGGDNGASAVAAGPDVAPAVPAGDPARRVRDGRGYTGGQHSRRARANQREDSEIHMNLRQCYWRVALFQTAPRLPNLEPNIFPRIVARWRQEGLPAGTSVAEFFGLDRADEFRGVGYDPLPGAPGRDAIRRELDRVAPVVQEGGYIPHLDHQIPDCPFADYAFYMEQKELLLASAASGENPEPQ
jgi:hypothetical protein